MVLIAFSRHPIGFFSCFNAVYKIAALVKESQYPVGFVACGCLLGGNGNAVGVITVIVSAGVFYVGSCYTAVAVNFHIQEPPSGVPVSREEARDALGEQNQSVVLDVVG